MNYEGIYLINKPVGITSFGVIARMRRVLGIKKIGHAGTLDPQAHGLMIVAVGREYTRMIDQYIGMDKSYTTVIKLGATSDTMDSEGPIESYSSEIPTYDEIGQVVMSQMQTYDQLPPNYSAKKIGGVPAYKLARAGKEVKLKTKNVTINQSQLIDYQYPYVTVKYHVSSGTYIRVLAHELGDKLGVGGYCHELCRDSIGEYKLSSAIQVYDVKDPNCPDEETWKTQLVEQAKIM